jgi:hypothetical protein
MHRIVGLETEYGLQIEDRGAADQVEEAIAFVRAYPGKHATGWDYRHEDPRRDARGFTAASLPADPVDARFDVAHPINLPENEIRSDRVLPNGARLYNDHGHPEYSTPECLSVADLVAHDKAGERIVLACARAYAEATGRAARVFKNNTDYEGASYGTHENYLALRSVPFERYAEALLSFLPTRVIFAGAGKAGSDRARGPAFEISQRASVFAEQLGIGTLYRRPLVNTRDEPHANPAVWRRIHVIAGDANPQQYATALKVGTTALVLDLVEDGYGPQMRLTDPVRAISQVSRDDTYRWVVETEGGSAGAIDLQRQFLAAAQRYAGRDRQTDWLLTEWEATLDGLERGPLELADRLDWPAKLRVLQTYMDVEGAEWGSDRVLAADLEYHNIDAEAGIFECLDTVRLVSEERIAQAVGSPPSDTRAAIRGAAVGRFADLIESITWGSFVLRDRQTIDLWDAVGEPLGDIAADLHSAQSQAEFVKALGRLLK